MRMLFASSDRDLLECFGKLFEPDGWETVTVFDGTQVISSLAKEKYDIVILDRNIPRIEYKEVLTRIKKKNIPVIVLIYESVTPKILNEELLPTSFLPFPFDPGKIRAVIDNVMKKAMSVDTVKAAGAEIDVSAFRLKNGPAVTAEETDVFISVTEGKPLLAEEKVYISSLNAKLAGSGAKTRRKYISKKGFAAVAGNE